MKPSRELDALVAEKVMGISKEKIATWDAMDRKSALNLLYCIHDELEPYSTDIRAAWDVASKFDWFCIEDQRDEFGILIEKAKCSLKLKNDPFEPVFYSIGDTTPHAICLAALKAVGYALQED